MSVSSYVCSRLFGKDASPRKRGKFPVRDHKLLAELLGRLGASRIANNLNQVAKRRTLGRCPLRPHAHAVWSRIDTESMTAVQLSHFKMKLHYISRELYLENDWKLYGSSQSGWAPRIYMNLTIFSVANTCSVLSQRLLCEKHYQPLIGMR